MFHRLPSPSSLRTFEAAARLLSFKRAAEELNVTPTAVSHQIRSLEEFLNIDLFIRRTRAVDLTPNGEKLSKVVHNSFADINQVLEEIRQQKKIINVSATPAFATLRLAPLLQDFHTRHPEITVRLFMGVQPIDLLAEHSVDVAIRYGTAAPVDNALVTQSLAQEMIGAYVAPGRISETEQITDIPLFETEWQDKTFPSVTWHDWMDQTEQTVSNRAEINRFADENFVIQAAIAGQGLALLSNVLADGLVKRNLLTPYRPDIQLHGFQYNILCRKDAYQADKIKTFIDWLKHALDQNEMSHETSFRGSSLN